MLVFRNLQKDMVWRTMFSWSGLFSTKRRHV